MIAVLGLPVSAEEPDAAAMLEALKAASQNQGHRLDQLAKQNVDIQLYQRLADVAVVDKVLILGPPRWNETNPTAKGAGGEVRFFSYIFTPRADFGGAKLPLLVLPHGGVHSSLSEYYIHVLRELLAQGYIVIAPDYRGSTGYGKAFYELIDYGGREVDDCLAARNWAVENHPRVDPKRVGILGWSHGGLITLMSLFDHKDSYVCGYAGVPVSDLVLRMGYMDQDYRDLYEAGYHIGQTASENLAEYKRRSPVWSAHKLERPLLIHTNPRDEDVSFIEVEHLIQALEAEKKDFEYKIYEAPGGHLFEVVDTPDAWAARREVYEFLARYLDPPVKKIRLGVGASGLVSP